LFLISHSFMHTATSLIVNVIWTWRIHEEPKTVKMMMTMTSSQSKLLLQLGKFYNERVQSRRASVTKNMRDVCAIVQDVLKEVETQEPRFVSSLSEINGYYEGLQVSQRLSSSSSLSSSFIWTKIKNKVINVHSETDGRVASLACQKPKHAKITKTKKLSFWNNGLQNANIHAARL